VKEVDALLISEEVQDAWNTTIHHNKSALSGLGLA
jgi:hypothetical protein